MVTRGADQPPRQITDLVDRREQQKCFKCGRWIDNNGSRHHRQRRREAGHRASVLVLLCGSGTTGCHGWVHAYPKQARAIGLIVRANGNLDCATVPVFSNYRGKFYQLDDEGNAIAMLTADAREILALAA